MMRRDIAAAETFGLQLVTGGLPRLVRAAAEHPTFEAFVHDQLNDENSPVTSVVAGLIWRTAVSNRRGRPGGGKRSNRSCEKRCFVSPPPTLASVRPVIFRGGGRGTSRQRLTSLVSTDATGPPRCGSPDPSSGARALPSRRTISVSWPSPPLTSRGNVRFVCCSLSIHAVQGFFRSVATREAERGSPTWNSWYDRYVPVADDLFDQHVAQLTKEGLI